MKYVYILSMLMCVKWWIKVYACIEFNVNVSDFLCERCAHMYTHIHSLNKWMNEVKECEWKVEFLGEHSLWVQLKYLVVTSLPNQELSYVGLRMDTHYEFTWSVKNLSLSFSNGYLRLHGGVMLSTMRIWRRAECTFCVEIFYLKYLLRWVLLVIRKWVTYFQSPHPLTMHSHRCSHWKIHVNSKRKTIP